jgi:hypothetical protein
LTPKIVETYTFELGYGGNLKQVQKNKKQILQFTSAYWNDYQKNYSTIKNESLSIVLYIMNFQSDLLNQKFFLHIDCKSAEEVLQKKYSKYFFKTDFCSMTSYVKCLFLF